MSNVRISSSNLNITRLVRHTRHRSTQFITDQFCIFNKNSHRVCALVNQDDKQPPMIPHDLLTNAHVRSRDKLKIKCFFLQKTYGKLDELKKETLNQILLLLLNSIVPLQTYFAKFDLVQLSTMKFPKIFCVSGTSIFVF